MGGRTLEDARKTELVPSNESLDRMRLQASSFKPSQLSGFCEKLPEINFINILLCSIVVICKTKQSRSVDFLIISIIDHLYASQVNKSLHSLSLCSGSMCICPSPIRHTNHAAELLVIRTNRLISTNLLQLFWQIVMRLSPIL